jgi:AraC family transcriptional regulator
VSRRRLPAFFDRAAPGAAVTRPLSDAAGRYAERLGEAGGRQQGLLKRDAPGAPAAALYASPAYDLHVPALPVARLAINLSAARVHGALEGDRSRPYEARRLSLFLTPAGMPAHWVKAQPSRHLMLYFEPDGVRGLGNVPLLGADGRAVQDLVQALVAELQQPDGFAAEAADSLGRLLLLRLARRPPRGGPALDAGRLARLREYVAAHLHEPLRVADMAAVCGLSPSRFAHAFGAATGQAPHRYVLEQRLAQAQAMLRRPGPPLAEVAAACGFASQQHLTQVMRRRLGLTPGRLRREALAQSAARPAEPGGIPPTEPSAASVPPGPTA